jgi:hypothetical protein
MSRALLILYNVSAVGFVRPDSSLDMLAFSKLHIMASSTCVSFFSNLIFLILAPIFIRNSVSVIACVLILRKSVRWLNYRLL